MEFPKLTFEGRKLNSEETEKVARILLSAQNHPVIEMPLAYDSSLREEFLAQVFLKRVTGYQLHFNITNVFFLLSMICFLNSPGKVMLLLRMCFEYAEEHHKTLLNASDWVYMFPWGVPSEEEWEQMWDSQKQDGLNMVDNIMYWKPAVSTVYDEDFAK